MRKLAKLRHGNGWAREIWAAILAYANGSQDGAGGPAFQSLVKQSLDWLGGDESDLEACQDFAGADLADLGNKYRPDIIQVLTWLCDPVRHRGLAVAGAEFLRKFGTAVQMRVDGNGTYKGLDDPLVYEWPDRIGSVITPICKFVLDQIERHDIYGDALRDAIPIGQCERDDCGRFFMVERVGRARFCSGLCRAKVHQSGLTKEQRAETMRRYRKGLKDRAARKSGTKNHKVRKGKS